MVLSQQEYEEWILEKYPGYEVVKWNEMAQDKIQWWTPVVKV
jgi:hypothetical protein